MPSLAKAIPRVKQTSTTTGTGNYTLVAVAGFNALSVAVTPGVNAIIACTVTMGAEYEEGIYTLTAANTLNRTKINRSSNANAAVNWTAGEKTIVQGPSVATALQGMHSFDDTGGIPGPSFTAGLGWGPGSMIFRYDEYDANPQNQHARLWVCRDTEHSGGYGHWLGVVTANGSGGADGKLTNYLSAAGEDPSRDSHAMGPSMDFMHGTIPVECVFATGFGGLAQWNNMVFKGAGWGTDVGEYEDILSVSLNASTTNATPTKTTNTTNSGNNQRNYLPIQLNSVFRFKGTVCAKVSNGDVSTWDVAFTVKRGTAGDPAFVGTADVTMAEQDAGAAAWAVTVGIDTTNDGVYVEVTGAAAITIRWNVNLQANKVAFA